MKDVNTCLLSVIIPIYNVEQYLEQCLDSIVSQSVEDWSRIEVILIDDGATDTSGKIADKYAYDYPFIDVIHKENAGVAAARNTGIRVASGEWLYFMDSDDWLYDDALNTMLREIQFHNTVDILLFDGEKNWPDKVEEWKHFEQRRVFTKQSEILDLQRGVLYFPSCKTHTSVPLAAPWDKVFKCSFIRNHGLGFRENLKVLDDMIFNMECFYEAREIAYCDKMIYHYRFVSNSITNQYKKDRIEQDRQVFNVITKQFEEKYAVGMSSQERYLFEQSYYLRVIKSLAIALRLCIFNDKSGRSVKEQLMYCREVCSLPEYRDAFSMVDICRAEWKLRIVILFVRMGWMRGVYFLHKLQNS